MRHPLSSLLVPSFLALVLIISCGGNSSDKAKDTTIIYPEDTALSLTVEVGDGFVTLSWGSGGTSRSNAVENECLFNIYMASESGLTPDNWGLLQDGTIHENVTSPYTIAGLKNNKTYYFILARVCNGEVSATGAVSSGSPAAPSGDQGEEGGAGDGNWSGISPNPVYLTNATAGIEQVTLFWDTPSDFSRSARTSSDAQTLCYNIYYKSGGENEFGDSPKIRCIWRGFGSYTVTGLSIGSTYYFAVTQTKEHIGEGKWGNQIAATPMRYNSPLPSQPGAPDLLAASDSGVSNSDDYTNDTTPTVQWTAMYGATGYKVSVDGGAAVDVGTATTYTPGALGDGAHTFTVLAYNSSGQTSQSAALTVTIDTTAPVYNNHAPVDLAQNVQTTITVTYNASGTDLYANAGTGNPQTSNPSASITVNVAPAITGGDGGTQVTLDVTSTALDGSGSVDLTVEDQAGNTTTTTLNFI